MVMDSRSAWTFRTREDAGVRSLTAGAEDADRPSIVLLPGLGAVGYLEDTLLGCAAGGASFLLDLPGFGGAGRRWPPEIGAQAAAVCGWLTAVQRRPVVLVGHSTAAQTALRVAATAPGLVAGVILLGPTFPPELRGLGRAAGALIRSLLRESPSALPGTVPYYLRAGPRALLRFIRSAQHDRPEDIARSVSASVLIARGRYDRLCPPGWAARLARVTGGELVTMPGAHAFPARYGGRTSALISSFADSVKGSGSPAAFTRSEQAPG